MDPRQHILLLFSSISLFGTVFCLALLAAKLLYSDNTKEIKKLILLLILFLSIFTVFLVNMLFYSFCDLAYINTVSLNFLSMILLPVIFYHIIFTLTKLNAKEKFSSIHYIIPLTIYFIYGTCNIFVPYSIRSQLAYSQTVIPSDYKWFSFLNLLSFFIKIGIGILYLSFSVKSIVKYRKIVINYSADMEASYLKWIYNIFACLFIIYIPIPVIYFISEQNSNLEYTAHILFNCAAFIFNITFCYNILMNNFTLITEDALYTEKEETSSTGVLSKQKFEAYIKENRPHLEYNLKITELALSLGTNRTYLSKFINENYQMNFSTYINKCRLDEMEKIKNQPSYIELPEAELVYLAGFKSYSSYQKTKETFK